MTDSFNINKFKKRFLQLSIFLWEKKWFFLSSLVVTTIAGGLSTEFTSFYWRFIIFIFIISAITILFINKKVAWSCFIIIMTFGTFFVIFSPVFDALDEPAHYARAQHISEGNLFLKNEEEELAFSKDYQFLTEMTGYNGINRLNPKINFFASDLFSYQHDEDKKIETKIKATRTYGSLVYLPSAMGLKIGQIISKGNLGVMFYLGRFFNLLMYAIMAFWAIKLAGRFDLLVGFFAIQHLPIYISASFNQDAFFYGLSLLILAKIINLFDKEEKIDYKDIIQMTIYCSLMTFTKLPSIALIGLMIFIPLDRYKSKKVYYYNFLGILIVLLIALLWLKYYSTMEATDLPKSVDQSEQLKYIFGHPREFMSSLLIGLLSTPLKFKQYFTFGWSYHYSEHAHLLSLPIFGAMLILYPLKLRHKVTNLFKFSLVSVMLAIIVVTNVILYLTFTGVGEATISGVQGRYFYGLLLLLPFLTNITDKIYLGDNFDDIGVLDMEKFQQIILMIAILILTWMSALRIGVYY